MRCPLLAASAMLLVALPARAERPRDAVTLTYVPSPAAVAFCPEADYLENEVFVRLRYELFQPTGSKHLTVKIDRSNGAFHAAGEMQDDEGNVLFAGTYPAMDCTFAVFSVAVAVAIRYAELPEPEPPPPSPPAPPSPAELPPPSPPAPEPVEAPAPPIVLAPPPERIRWQGGIASVFSIGTAPSVLGGVGGFVGVRWPSVSLALEGRALFAPSATLERATVRDGYHFDFAAISGTGCYHPEWAFVCARAEVGSLSFGNPDVSVSPSHMTFVGLGLRLGADRTLTSWLALRAYVEILAQPLPGHLNTDSTGQAVWNQAGVSGSIGLGPIFTFSGG